MKNKKISIILGMIIILSLIIILYIMKDSIKIYFKTYTFKHINTNDIEIKYEDDENPEYKYGYFFVDRVQRDKCAAIILKDNKKTTIEENIIYRYVDDGEDANVQSIIYSKQKLDKEIVGKFLLYLHNYDKCGAPLKQMEKVIENYYYIEYRIPSEC